MLIIIGYVHVDPSALRQFMDDMKLLANSVHRRGGNISYNIAVEDRLAGKLLISERWKDQVALCAHLESADTVAFIERWQNSMKGEVLKYDVFNERGLMAL
ncbi:putative quinol monooxygenase [Rahnella sp. CJA17(1/100)]|uniref:putative quinol monooxygenase n=1 Tax=Rahnella sp. CJA17(1/100) TaxID=2508951 RepID=UPI00106FCED9|nr:antibiotic biosynthesis monooxygenase [Rahnella sp. CJA17(1/100)]